MRRRWPLWRTALFFAGLATLLAALASPIDGYAAVSFAVHMVQHMLLTVVAAPLLMLGAPVRPLLRGVPAWVRGGVVRPLARARTVRAFAHLVRHPLVAAALYVGGLYAWHLPSLYDAALVDARVHLIEHAWFFFSALIFWSVVIDPEPFRATLGYRISSFSARRRTPFLVGSSRSRRVFCTPRTRLFPTRPSSTWIV